MSPTATTVAREVMSGVLCGAAVLLAGWLMEGQANWGYAVAVAVGITLVSLAVRARQGMRARRADAP